MKKYAEAAPIAINFTVDVDQGITVNPKSLTIQQGEHNARYFQVSLVHNEMPVNLANSEVHFLTQPHKSDEIPTTTNCEIYDAENGQIMVAVKDYMSNKKGIINGEFVRVGKDGSSLPFKHFTISVDGSIFVNDGLGQSEPLHSLVSALARVQRVEEYLEQEFMDVEAKYAGELSKTNAKLIEVANKGTTVEVIERVTKEEIDRQIKDGTMTNLTIADGSIGMEKLDPDIELGVQIDDDVYSPYATWSSEQIKNMLDSKLNSDVMENILIYPSLYNLKDINSCALPSFKYNKKFAWAKSPLQNGTPHSVVVVDVSKYVGQTISIDCEYLYKENNTLVNNSQIILVTAVDKTINSYPNNNGGPQWTRIDSVYPALTDGYYKYNKTFTVSNNRPYMRLTFVNNTKAPTNISLSFNVKINGDMVTPVALGGFFEGDEVKVSNIGGGGSPILPPEVGEVEGVVIDGTKVLLPDGYELDRYLNYLKELIDNIDGNSSSGNGTNVTNALINKVWAILGDSISNPSMYAKTHYYKYIANRNPGLVYNASQGISGTRIAKRSDSDTQAMCYRYRNLASNANIITVFGGVNDWGQPNPTPLGKFTDTTEVNSFYGALHSLCKNLIQKYPSALILFITPMSQKGFGGFPNTDENSLGFTVLDYGNAIIEVCGNYGIPVFDLGKCGGITPKIPEQKSLYFTDGLHLNDRGHERLSYLLERELLRYIYN